MLDILQLNDMLVPELREIAEKLEIKSYKRLSKQDLIYKILDHQALSGGEKSTSAKETPKTDDKPKRRRSSNASNTSKKEETKTEAKEKEEVKAEEKPKPRRGRKPAKAKSETAPKKR